MKFYCDCCDAEMTWSEVMLAEESGEWRYCKANHSKKKKSEVSG